MKFNDKELELFKEDLIEDLKVLERKYKIKIDLGKFSFDDTFFSVRLNAEHQAAKTDAVLQQEEKKIIPHKPEIKTEEKKIVPHKPEPKVEEKKIVPHKPEPKVEEKKIVPHKPEPKVEEKKIVPSKSVAPAPKKKSSDLDDLDLDNLDIDSLDFSDLGADEPKKAPKKEKIEDLDNIDDLDDLDIDSLDFSDLGADEEPEEDPVEKPAPKKKAKYEEDDEDRYEQELQKYLNKKYDDEPDDEPSTIFDEKDSYDDDISEDEIDAYLASTGRYSFSFQAKLIQADGNVQDIYTDIKNILLSYSGVRSKVSWDNDTFTHNGKEVAKINIDGSDLVLYLKLDPSDYDGSGYHNLEKAKGDEYKSTPLKYVIGSLKDEDSAYELIEDLASENRIFPGEDRYDDYHFEYETNDELIARGLIKKK